MDSGEAQKKAEPVLGYRGGDLLLFGGVYVAIGLSVLSDPGYIEELVHTHLPLWFRLFLWVGFGIFAMLAAFKPRLRALGFAALAIPPAERALSNGWAVLHFFDFSRSPGFFVYLIFTVMVVRFASRPEPTDVPITTPARLEK
jgi:hypothetical protein